MIQARSREANSDHLALTQVCHEIRHEALGLFYQLNTLRFPISLATQVLPPSDAATSTRSHAALCGWLRNQDEPIVRVIGSINLDASTWKLFRDPAAGDHEATEVAENLRAISKAFEFLRAMDVSISVRLRVFCTPGLMGNGLDVLFRFPMDDRATLRAGVGGDDTGVACANWKPAG